MRKVFSVMLASLVLGAVTVAQVSASSAPDSEGIEISVQDEVASEVVLDEAPVTQRAGPAPTCIGPSDDNS